MTILYLSFTASVLVISAILIARLLRKPKILSGRYPDLVRTIIDRDADPNYQARIDFTRPSDLDTRLPFSIFEQLKSVDPASQEAYQIFDRVVDSIQLELNTIDKQHWAVELITKPRKLVHIIYWLELEINNGGFSQYYINPAGDYAAETPDALRTVHLNVFASLVEKANSFFPEGPPIDRPVRLAIYDEAEKRAGDTWSQLNNRYFNSGIECCPALVQYILAHQTDFFQSQ